jgi:hypothetical protein
MTVYKTRCARTVGLSVCMKATLSIIRYHGAVHNDAAAAAAAAAAADAAAAAAAAWAFNAFSAK